MNQNLFRKSSTDRISSPEQLNEYVRVANPGVWIVLAAIIVLLIGVCVWGCLGHLETTLSAVGISDGTTLVVLVRESDIASVRTDMTVTVGDAEYAILDIAQQPMAADAGLGEYALHVGGLQTGEWVYPVTVDAALTAGVYGAEIITERVSPISFIIN